MTSMTGSMGMKGPTGAMAGQKLAGGYKQGQMPNFTPEQMQLFQSLFSQVAPDSYTSRLAGGDESLFQEMEAPALRQFSGLQGNLASRFSGMGGLGARRSSGFQNTMNQASSDFAQDLQSRRQSLQQNAIKDLMSMSKDLLGERPNENFLIEPNKRKSFWQQFASGALPIAGAAAGGFFGGPAGAAVGGQLGAAAGRGFSGEEGGQMDFSGMGNLPTSWGNMGNRLSGATAQYGGQQRQIYAGAY